MIIRKFLDPNTPSLPQQVSENTKDIAELEENIKPWYNTQNMLMESSSTIALSDTNIGTATTGFLLSKNALLFKIVGVEEGVVYISYWASLPRGEQGEQGEQGETGNGIQSISKIETNGFVDTYQIRFTNGATYNFNITNGEGFNYMGIWIAENEYYINDVVKFNDNLYILITNELIGSDTPPNVDVANWSLFLPKGQNGLNGSGINPNLLINGDFRVNQRGQSSYSPRRNWVHETYSADRWQIYGTTNGSFNPKTKMLAGQVWLYQILSEEDTKSLFGKTVTLSCDVIENGTSAGTHFLIRQYKTDGTVSDIVNDNYATFTGLYQKTIQLPEDDVSNPILYFEIVIYQSSTANKKINYVKLEIGNTATANSPKTYAEELLSCQRFFQIKTNTFTFETSPIDRTPEMRIAGTTGTTEIDGVNYNYCDAEIYV